MKSRLRLPRSTGAMHPNENPAFIESFRRLERERIPHLLLSSGNDNRWLEFQEIVLQHYLAGRTAGDAYRIELVDQS